MQVLDAMPQDIAIRSTGNDVALLRPLGEMGEEAPLDALPDPIDLFVRAVNEQMFTLGQETACDSSARVDQRSYDETERTARWVVHIDHAHPACLRVLYNLLSARDFESVEVRGTMPAPEPSTTVSTSGAMPLDVARVPYPPVLQELPFEVEYEEGNRALRDRLLQVEFRTPPEDEVVDRLSDVITFWCDLLLLGGYPPEDMAPREAGVMAEGPLLFDECTVQVAFPELFHADDKAFDALLNHLSCLTDRGIKKVCIR
jgi:hypothetical protein